MREGTTPRSVPEQRHLSLLVFLNKYAVLYYSCFILLLSLFYTNHLVSIILFNYDYLNSMTILLCLCFYSLYYHFVNLNFICNNNNLYTHLSIHSTHDTDEEITDFKIYLSIISNDVILMLFYLTTSAKIALPYQIFLTTSSLLFQFLLLFDLFKLSTRRPDWCSIEHCSDNVALSLNG